MENRREFSEENLKTLLQEAATEKDRTKSMEILRKVNRVRAERWLQNPLVVMPERHSDDPKDTFELFTGPADRDAVWLDRITGIEEARRRIHEFAADKPGEYFVFQPLTRSVPIRIDSRIMMTRQPKLGFLRSIE